MSKLLRKTFTALIAVPALAVALALTGCDTHDSGSPAAPRKTSSPELAAAQNQLAKMACGTKVYYNGHDQNGPSTNLVDVKIRRGWGGYKADITPKGGMYVTTVIDEVKGVADLTNNGHNTWTATLDGHNPMTICLATISQKPAIDKQTARVQKLREQLNDGANG